MIYFYINSMPLYFWHQKNQFLLKLSITYKDLVKSLTEYKFCLHRYRLVPKVYFPAQVDDVVRATKYFLQPEVLQKYSVDPSRIGISGDSAGGNLAAALAQQVTDRSEVLAVGECMIMSERAAHSLPHVAKAYTGGPVTRWPGSSDD